MVLSKLYLAAVYSIPLHAKGQRSSPLALLFSTGSALPGRLQHRPLDCIDTLLEAGGAHPWEYCRRGELRHQPIGAEAGIRVVVDGGAEAASQQLASLLAFLALTRCWCQTGTVTSHEKRNTPIVVYQLYTIGWMSAALTDSSLRAAVVTR